MKKQQKHNKVKDLTLQKDITEIKKFFHDLEKDKTLPTFGDFFMLCLILGIEEKVNLKVMYPKVYKKLSRRLKQHNRAIEAMQRKQDFKK